MNPRENTYSTALPDSPGFWLQWLHPRKVKLLQIVCPPYLEGLYFYDARAAQVFRPVADLDRGYVYCRWLKVREPTGEEIFALPPTGDPPAPICDLPDNRPSNNSFFLPSTNKIAMLPTTTTMKNEVKIAIQCLEDYDGEWHDSVCWKPGAEELEPQLAEAREKYAEMLAGSVDANPVRLVRIDTTVLECFTGIDDPDVLPEVDYEAGQGEIVCPRCRGKMTLQNPPIWPRFDPIPDLDGLRAPRDPDFSGNPHPICPHCKGIFIARFVYPAP